MKYIRNKTLILQVDKLDFESLNLKSSVYGQMEDSP